jgi:ubiquitin-protein ligase
MSLAAGRNVPPERIAREYLLLKKEASDFSIVGQDMTHYFGFIAGRGLYEGGIFTIEFEMTENYPYDPPIITIWSKIWHPNFKSKAPPLVTHWVDRKPVYWDFDIRIATGDWQSGNDLLMVIRELQLLLSCFDDPKIKTAFNPNDPINPSAAMQYKEDANGFKKVVRDWVQRYATWNNFQTISRIKKIESRK